MRPSDRCHRSNSPHRCDSFTWNWNGAFDSGLRSWKKYPVSERNVLSRRVPGGRSCGVVSAPAGWGWDAAQVEACSWYLMKACPAPDVFARLRLRGRRNKFGDVECVWWRDIVVRPHQTLVVSVCVKRTFMLKSFACVSKSTLLRGELLVHFQIYLRNSITYEYETKVFWISTTRAHLSIC